MLPEMWADRLSTATHRSTIFVALQVLKLDWKSEGAPVAISNVGLKKWGITRQEKWIGLGELEALKLITVERVKGRSPRITRLC
jgi:hypothetical protein